MHRPESESEDDQSEAGKQKPKPKASKAGQDPTLEDDQAEAAKQRKSNDFKAAQDPQSKDLPAQASKPGKPRVPKDSSDSESEDAPAHYTNSGKAHTDSKRPQDLTLQAFKTDYPNRDWQPNDINLRQDPKPESQLGQNLHEEKKLRESKRDQAPVVREDHADGVKGQGKGKEPNEKRELRFKDVPFGNSKQQGGPKAPKHRPESESEDDQAEASIQEKPKAPKAGQDPATEEDQTEAGKQRTPKATKHIPESESDDNQAEAGKPFPLSSDSNPPDPRLNYPPTQRADGIGDPTSNPTPVTSNPIIHPKRVATTTSNLSDHDIHTMPQDSPNQLNIHTPQDSSNQEPPGFACFGSEEGDEEGTQFTQFTQGTQGTQSINLESDSEGDSGDEVDQSPERHRASEDSGIHDKRSDSSDVRFDMNPVSPLKLLDGLGKGFAGLFGKFVERKSGDPVRDNDPPSKLIPAANLNPWTSGKRKTQAESKHPRPPNPHPENLFITPSKTPFPTLLSNSPPSNSDSPPLPTNLPIPTNPPNPTIRRMDTFGLDDPNPDTLLPIEDAGDPVVMPKAVNEVKALNVAFDSEDYTGASDSEDEDMMKR